MGREHYRVVHVGAAVVKHSKWPERKHRSLIEMGSLRLRDTGGMHKLGIANYMFLNLPIKRMDNEICLFKELIMNMPI